MRAKRKALSVWLLALASACLLLSACAQHSDETPEPTEPPQRTPLPEMPQLPEAREKSEYDHVKVYFDGLLSDKGYLVEDTVYLSPEYLCDFFGVELDVQTDKEGLTITAEGLKLTAQAGQEYMLANSRYLFTPYGYLEADGRVYLPADAVERVFGVNVILFGDPVQAEVSGENVRFLVGGEDYYTRTFPDEEIFWLSHIINAEAKNEPIAGLIGVGNVVYNRIADPAFPNTLLDVIYDHEHTIQFEAISTGGLLDKPEPTSMIATYLCLEGYNTVGDSLYFANPSKGINPWFYEALTPTAVIGNHYFYIW